MRRLFPFLLITSAGILTSALAQDFDADSLIEGMKDECARYASSTSENARKRFVKELEEAGKSTPGIWGLEKAINADCMALKSPDFSPRSDAEHIESIKVLSFGNEFREVMTMGVNQEKFREGIA